MGTEYRSTSRVRKIAFTLVVFFALCGTLEGIARFNYVEPHINYVAPQIANQHGMLLGAHPSRIWWMNPGSDDAYGVTFTVNNQGQRTTPEALARNRSKKGDRLRVLTIGDSSIVGHGLPDAYTPHAQMEEAFANVGMDVEVLSGATPGYSTEQSLVFLDEDGWDLEPDLLLVGSMWSDNNLRPALWLDNEIAPWHRTDRDWLAELKRRALSGALQRHSRAVSWLFRTLGDTETDYFAVSWQQGDSKQTEDEDEGFRRVPMEQYAMNLTRISQQAAEHDAGVIFLEPCNWILLSGLKKQENTTWAPYFRAMQKVADLQDAPIVNGCDTLLAAGLNSSTAFIDEIHPGAKANRAYANALVQKLLKKDWPNDRLLGSGDALRNRQERRKDGESGRFQDKWKKKNHAWLERIDPTYDSIEPTADSYFALTKQTLMLEPDQFIQPNTKASTPPDSEIAEIKETLRLFDVETSEPLEPLLVRKTDDGRYQIMRGAALWVNAKRAGWPTIPANISPN